MSVLLDNTGKFGRNYVYVGNAAFVSKNLCFQQPLRCYRNDLITCIKIAIIPCDA